MDKKKLDLFMYFLILCEISQFDTNLRPFEPCGFELSMYLRNFQIFKNSDMPSRPL
jgi:hypothetical protein